MSIYEQMMSVSENTDIRTVFVLCVVGVPVSYIVDRIRLSSVTKCFMDINDQ